MSEQQIRRQIAPFSQDRNVPRNVGILFPSLRTQSSKLPLNMHPETQSKPLHSCTDSLLCSTRRSGIINSQSFNCACTDTYAQEKIGYFLHYINVCIIPVIIILPHVSERQFIVSAVLLWVQHWVIIEKE